MPALVWDPIRHDHQIDKLPWLLSLVLVVVVQDLVCVVPIQGAELDLHDQFCAAAVFEQQVENIRSDPKLPRHEFQA